MCNVLPSVRLALHFTCSNWTSRRWGIKMTEDAFGKCVNSTGIFILTLVWLPEDRKIFRIQFHLAFAQWKFCIYSLIPHLGNVLTHHNHSSAGEDCTLWSFLQCNFSHSPRSPSQLVPIFVLASEWETEFWTRKEERVGLYFHISASSTRKWKILNWVPRV